MILKDFVEDIIKSSNFKPDNAEEVKAFINTYIYNLFNMFDLEKKDYIIYLSGSVTNINNYENRFDEMEFISYKAFASHSVYIINPIPILSTVDQFDFTLLERFLGEAQKCGIKYFEHAHLFTQWGAGFTPKIMATVNGKEKRIFGWDVAADSEEYKTFLDAFLPALIRFIEENGLGDKVYFHCSDEPCLKQLDQFKKCASLLTRHLKGWNLFDGGTLDAYKNGLPPIPIPICPERAFEQFLQVDVPERWVAYCCFPQEIYVNRFIHMTSSRNRIWGSLLYRFNVDGFLHWGFNFYYSGLSLKPVDPYKDTCCYFTYPAGDAFLVYPRKDGVPEESLRLKVFGHGLQDMRALRLLESLIGREKVEKLLDKVSPEGKMHMHDYPRGEKAVLALREKINAMIKKNLKK